MTIIQRSTATVYTVPGVNRRFLSKNAALVAHCRRKIKKAHPCECEGDVGFTCFIHSDKGYDWFEKLQSRYYKLAALWDKTDKP